MRIASLLTLVVSAAWLSAGCAAPRATSEPPTLDELPKIEFTERVLPATIGVEGTSEDPTVMLVPSFEEPELTPEERLALGESAESFNWLEFYTPLPGVLRICPDYGGPETGVTGIGGAAVWLSGFVPPFRTGHSSNPVQSVHFERDQRYGAAGERGVAGLRGPGEAMRVGVNPPRHAATHATSPER